MANKTYLAIDLKSFYASVECVEKGLDPLNTNLVVADDTRTDKTICLAVTPSLKSFGISGRARLYEVVQKVKIENARRILKAPNHEFAGKSYNYDELIANPSLELDYIVARPRMQYYMKYSADIFNIYLKYVAPEDMHVYSVDEVFMDVTRYLHGRTPKDFAMEIIKDVLSQTGITATAGIGTNLYLCKIAMDIVAKHIPADENGVRIAELDEKNYRTLLWEHKPITDFWRIGKGIAKRLEDVGIFTMGDIAKCSLGNENDYYNEDLLYKLFGKNAELIIDHAWGYEPCDIKEIKDYRPDSNSLCSGQVLMRPYTYEECKIIVREMVADMALNLTEKKLLTNQIVLLVGYDIANITDKKYEGETKKDFYGRTLPKEAHGTANLGKHTSSMSTMMDAVFSVFEREVNKDLVTRRVTIIVNNLITEDQASQKFEQLSIFDNEKETIENVEKLAQEKKLQQTVVSIKQKYGKNSIVKGTSFKEGATGRERNSQIGGHKA